MTNSDNQHDDHEQRQKRKVPKIFGFAVGLLGVYLLISGMISYLDQDREFKNLQLFPISGPVSARPEIRNPRKGAYVSFELQNFRGVEFHVSAKSGDLISSVNIGDSLYLLVDDLYHKKFLSSHRNWVEVCAVRSAGEVFVSLENYKRESIASHQVGLFIAALGVVFIGIFVIQLYTGFRAEWD
jgi:hypothetical protein